MNKRLLLLVMGILFLVVGIGLTAVGYSASTTLLLSMLLFATAFLFILGWAAQLGR